MHKKLVLIINMLFFGFLVGTIEPHEVQAVESETVATAESSAVSSTSEIPADSLLADIKERGVIRLGLSPDYPPFEFSTMQNGENVVAGIDVSLGEKIAEDLGVELEVVEMDFSSLIPALETGSIDIIVSGMTSTPDRDESVDFSSPYEISNQAIVIREEDKSLFQTETDFTDEHAIGVQQASLQEITADEYLPQTEKLTMQQIPDLLNALKTGQVDGVVMDAPVAGANVAENPDLDYFEMTATADRTDGKSVVVPENQPALLESINNSVDEVVEKNLVETWEQEAFDLIEASQGSSWLSYWPYFWEGIKTTLLISVVSIVAGLILGSILALMRLTDSKILNFIATAYIEFLRGTPLMIQVLFMFLGVGGLLGLSPLVAGLIAVSLNSSAYIAEIIRGGIQAVDKGQTEAARSLGLNRVTTLTKVVYPQSLRSIWPSLGNEFVTLIKESSIVSTIGISELTFQTRAVTSITYEGIIPLLISMVIYFILTFTLTKILNYYERKMNLKYQ